MAWCTRRVRQTSKGLIPPVVGHFTDTAAKQSFHYLFGHYKNNNDLPLPSPLPLTKIPEITAIPCAPRNLHAAKRNIRTTATATQDIIILCARSNRARHVLEDHILDLHPIRRLARRTAIEVILLDVLKTIVLAQFALPMHGKRIILTTP